MTKMYQYKLLNIYLYKFYFRFTKVALREKYISWKIILVLLYHYLYDRLIMKLLLGQTVKILHIRLQLDQSNFNHIGVNSVIVSMRLMLNCFNTKGKNIKQIFQMQMVSIPKVVTTLSTNLHNVRARYVLLKHDLAFEYTFLKL